MCFAMGPATCAGKCCANAFMYVISPDYCTPRNNPSGGRTFTWHDDRARAGSPCESRIRRADSWLNIERRGQVLQGSDGTRIEVVGVVEDGKYLSVTEAQQPAVFLPVTQQDPLVSSGCCAVGP